MVDPLENRRILLGVTGSIACYKGVDLASKLAQHGAQVDVILTRAAESFLTPLTFSAITHRPVVTNIFDPTSEIGMDHISMAQRADVVVVAPATAHTIAKMAQGLADDALTTTVLATKAPIVVAPAMDANMYENPATQANIETLESRGVLMAGPVQGRLASGLMGTGRMLEPAELIGYIKLTLGRNGDLAGRKIVVSAGGTQEAVDPVRVLTNRSSGKMGYAVAEAARDRGATAVLVSAPTALPDPIGVKVVHIETALEMRDAVKAECADGDAVIMAAAVADWRPAEIADQKIKKNTSDTLSIELVKNPDILSELPAGGLVKVGFAAESEDLLINAQEKLQRKGLDLIAANDITADDAGFVSDDNRVVLVDRDGAVERVELTSKYDVASRILDRVAALLQ